MPKTNAVYKKLAASELGRGHTSGIVPTTETADYFGVPSRTESHVIKRIVIEFWSNGKNHTIETNVHWFHARTHNHIHLTGQLMPQYTSSGATVGDAVVFWQSIEKNHYKAELIKKNSPRWAEIEGANRNFARNKGGYILLSEPDFISASHQGDTDATYQIDSKVSDGLNEADFAPKRRIGGRKERSVRALPRDRIKGNYVLKKQNYLCQIDSGHHTFTTKNGNKYMEKHHLIPMEYYETFEYDIDDIGNIVSLCPTCHRKIHLGVRNEKEAMIRQLFEQQKDVIHSRLHTDLTIESLLGLYLTT